MSNLTENDIEAKIEEHIKAVMDLLELDITPSNEGTPHRVAKMWAKEVFANRNNRNIEELNAKMKTFPDEYNNDLVIVRDIPFSSTCEHHWLPFSGKVTVAYVPNGKVIGLSKIPRVVKYFSKQPTLQEKLGRDIGNYLFEILEPCVIYVFITSTHSCVKCRGAESDCSTSTQYSMYNNKLGLTQSDIETLNSNLLQRVGVI